ncbi:hypothetical protein RchiOBHm_Chr6g0307741 [Rosa chinensis]|uniref:Uncharacterized protein n=1 Tax=Rosa chinensis TaxID=74649 RepID=A0A2P6Q0E5_ROSCH|nr:hypothetical protein RchiOBHm_Chr6g0307741 [Rosa chinensis]
MRAQGYASICLYTNHVAPNVLADILACKCTKSLPLHVNEQFMAFIIQNWLILSSTGSFLSNFYPKDI